MQPPSWSLSELAEDGVSDRKERPAGWNPTFNQNCSCSEDTLLLSGTRPQHLTRADTQPDVCLQRNINEIKAC